MVKRTLTLLALLFTATLLQGGSRFLDRHPAVADAVTLLDLWINEQMAYRQLPSLTIGIVYDQQLIWAQGYGYADLDRQVPATPQTLYRIASITKTFTSTAIMQLRDAGRLVLCEYNYPPEDDALDNLTYLTPVGKHTFRMADGENVVFELGKDGKVERIRKRYDYIYPRE